MMFEKRTTHTNKKQKRKDSISEIISPVLNETLLPCNKNSKFIADEFRLR